MTETVTIRGKVPSKSNGYKIVSLPVKGKDGKWRDRHTLAKSDALVIYERDFFRQCPLRHRKISVPFRLDMDVYYADDRPDLDNSLKVVLDCLQACQAIKNDRLCAEIHARKLIDRRDPRIELRLTELM